MESARYSSGSSGRRRSLSSISRACRSSEGVGDQETKPLDHGVLLWRRLGLHASDERLTLSPIDRRSGPIPSVFRPSPTVRRGLELDGGGVSGHPVAPPHRRFPCRANAGRERQGGCRKLIPMKSALGAAGNTRSRRGWGKARQAGDANRSGSRAVAPAGDRTWQGDRRRSGARPIDYRVRSRAAGGLPRGPGRSSGGCRA
jgi:hypothetical protein